MNSTQPVTADSQDAPSDDPVKDPTYWPFIIVGVRRLDWNSVS
jgi:hypothetical protein